jgi:hypothetical protein
MNTDNSDKYPPLGGSLPIYIRYKKEELVKKREYENLKEAVSIIDIIDSRKKVIPFIAIT